MATSTETRADIVADIRRRAPAWLDPVFTEIDLRLAERIEAADEPLHGIAEEIRGRAVLLREPSSARYDLMLADRLDAVARREIA